MVPDDNPQEPEVLREVREILRLYQEGNSPANIARILGESMEFVEACLARRASRK